MARKRATSSPVIGIDLGTTNSAAAYFDGTKTVIIPVDGEPLLPSVVGFDDEGTMLVGRPARNQRLLYPELTVRSIKRQMGESGNVTLGKESFSPVEISAFILRRLKLAAEAHIGEPVDRAVITVPAYFSDAARTATREAGEVAGFTVERIINEPTAAALCYADPDDESDRTFLVYDLGGGTFDVSIVRARGEVTEVLASHGDTKLGGDDMDEILRTNLHDLFRGAHGVDVDDPRALARLERATEEAKIRLSEESYVRVIEEHLVTRKKKGLHLDTEVSRATYNDLIQDLVERTIESVEFALDEAGIDARDLDDVILVGGASRTPLVRDTLYAMTGIMPRIDVNPDEAVALGASISAARVAGRAPNRILVDVTPYSYGISYLGDINGYWSPDCYSPLIKRNTPIPTRHSEMFQTTHDGQARVDIDIYQGESSHAPSNILVGRFTLEGLDEKATAGNPVVVDLQLDLNGVLHVEAREKRTGVKADITIKDAFATLSDSQRDAAGSRVIELLANAGESPIRRTPQGIPDGLPEDQVELWTTAHDIMARAEDVSERLESTDRDELGERLLELRNHLDARSWAAVMAAAQELDDVLFYLE